MQRNVLTIWVAIGLSRKIRTFTLHHNIIRFAILICIFTGIALVTLSITFTQRYNSLKEQVVVLERLKAENKRQQEQLDYFSKNLFDLQQQVNRLQEFGQKLQELTSAEPFKRLIEPGSKDYGLGGPLEDTAELWEEVSPSSKDKEEISIEGLRAQITLQKQAFEKLEKTLKRKRKMFLSIPSIWPVEGRVVSGFGKRRSPFNGRPEWHRGVDILAKPGTPIRATASGVVIEAGRMPGLGNYIKIDHGNGIITRYGHNKKNLVRKGQRVKKGQIIAYVGNTGKTTGPHLHYEVMVRGKYRDPLAYILD